MVARFLNACLRYGGNELITLAIRAMSIFYLLILVYQVYLLCDTLHLCVLVYSSLDTAHSQFDVLSHFLHKLQRQNTQVGDHCTRRYDLALSLKPNGLSFNVYYTLKVHPLLRAEEHPSYSPRFRSLGEFA